MSELEGVPVTLSVREARVQLCRILRGYRERPEEAEPVYIGTHRQADAVLLSAELFHELAKWAERGRSMAVFFDDYDEVGISLREH